MAKRIHHMGMTISKKEHDEFHAAGGELAPERHAALMKKLGVTSEEDEAWHRTHLTLAEQRTLGRTGAKGVDPFAVGAGFLAWCVKQGWLIERGKQYFAAADGARELRERFEISV